MTSFPVLERLSRRCPTRSPFKNPRQSRFSVHGSRSSRLWTVINPLDCPAVTDSIDRFVSPFVSTGSSIPWVEMVLCDRKFLFRRTVDFISPSNGIYFKNYYCICNINEEHCFSCERILEYFLNKITEFFFTNIAKQEYFARCVYCNYERGWNSPRKGIPCIKERRRTTMSLQSLPSICPLNYLFILTHISPEIYWILPKASLIATFRFTLFRINAHGVITPWNKFNKNSRTITKHRLLFNRKLFELRTLAQKCAYLHQQFSLFHYFVAHKSNIHH